MLDEYEMFAEPQSDRAMQAILARYEDKTGQLANVVAFRGRIPELSPVPGVGFMLANSSISSGYVAVYRRAAQRIQRKRTKGWRMPDNAIYVGRPTKWGNPYSVGYDGDTRKDVVILYREHLKYDPELVKAAKRELVGKDLACWCSLDQACHADVLLELLLEEKQ